MSNASNRPYNTRVAAARYAVYSGMISLALCAVLIVVGTRTQANSWAFLAAGGVGIIITVGLVGVGLAIAEHGGSQSEGFEQQLGELTRAVADLREQGSLSEGARRVLNRRRDREVLRAAIEEDIATEEWDAAMVLVDELAQQFGYRADAEEFRARIEQARHDTVQRKVAEGVQRVDELLVQRRWDSAMGEALRLRRLHPESPRAQTLRERVEHARLIYKGDLERRFLQAAQESRVEEAMDLLRELDAYLSEQEAEPYREVARGVIGKARENLGARFKIAVQDKRWQEASRLGDQIIEQFPNSRMAGEVRELLDSIRARAQSVSAVG